MATVPSRLPLPITQLPQFFSQLCAVSCDLRLLSSLGFVRHSLHNVALSRFSSPDFAQWLLHSQQRGLTVVFHPHPTAPQLLVRLPALPQWQAQWLCQEGWDLRLWFPTLAPDCNHPARGDAWLLLAHPLLLSTLTRLLPLPADCSPSELRWGILPGFVSHLYGAPAVSPLSLFSERNENFCCFLPKRAVKPCHL